MNMCRLNTILFRIGCGITTLRGLASRTTYHVCRSIRLSDEQLRMSVAHRLGCKACEPHTCGCGKVLYGLACQ